MSEEKSLAKGAAVSRADQSKNFSEEIEGVRENLCEIDVTKLENYWLIGQRTGKILGITRNREGAVVEDADAALSTYGMQTLESIAEVSNMDRSAVGKCLLFFRSVPRDRMLEMKGAKQPDGSMLFSWNVVRALIAGGDAERINGLVESALKQNWKLPTLIKAMQKSKTTTRSKPNKKAAGNKSAKAADAFLAAVTATTERINLVDSCVSQWTQVSKDADSEEAKEMKIRLREVYSGVNTLVKELEKRRDRLEKLLKA